MTSETLSPTQLNFARFSILCVDIITLPLKDILDKSVKPADLDNRIKACPPLLTGISKLNPDQKKKCCFNSSNTPDYSAFDITLLYKLIRYLCPSLEPPNRWGTKPTVNDVSIGDDIERIRELRNKRFAHAECGKISDDDFMELWSDAKRIIKRCQDFTTRLGCNTDYNQMIVDLQKRTLTVDEYISNVECSGAIYISGDTKVPCGNTAHFEAEISTEQDVYMPLNWDRVDGLVREEINIENKKYEGSDNRNLIINNVCMNDEGGYQAVISRKHDVKILSNRVYIRPKGDLPCLDELNTTTKSGEIYIHYVFNVSDNSPTVNDIKWTIDESFLELSSNKYRGGGLADDRLTILRPGEDDKGLYTCTVSNAVGPVSKSIKLDIPSAEILSTTNLKVMFGSDTRLNCSVSGYPSANKVEWQNSLDGRTFYPTDIDEDKYFGSSSDPCSPFLLVRNATLYDQQYYRVIVSNEIGKYTSNRHFLQVTGGKPNMSEVTCTFQGHSVKLNCGVFLYDESPALNDVYWTKNGMKIEIEKNNGKYSGMDINDPSLTINRVNHNDAGDYQLTAVNAVGETESEVIVLGVPKVHLEKCDKKEDGSLSFTMTIKSVPVPHAVQWIMKEHGSESVQPINVNVAEYRGTTNTFPHPVLVIKHLERLENCSFEIEVKNRIGEAKARIPGEINQQIAKRKKSTLGKFHIDGGSRVPFSKLLNELARKFPKEKVNQLKYLIRVSCNIKEVKELDQAENAADCFIILWKEELITTSNVIAMQFLLQETECEDLERKCVEFAKKQNAIYYYEKPPENGWRNVRFHVDAIIHHFSTDEETKIKETVANIVGCSIEDIRVHGYLNGMSFFIVLAIKDIYIEKLLNIKEHDKDKLRKLNIDYFKDDFKTISLKRTTEVKDEPSIMFDHEKGSSEPSKKCSIADKSQNKLEPADTWTEDIELGSLRVLLESFKIVVPHSSRESFVKTLLDETLLNECVYKVRSLARRVVLCKNFDEKYKKQNPGTVMVYEVIVMNEDDEVFIYEKDPKYWSAFFEEKREEDLVKVILIKGIWQNVSMTKEIVYQKYLKYIDSGKFHLHHESEQYSEIAKISALQSIKLCQQYVESVRASIPLDTIDDIVKKSTYRALTEERIKEMCCNTYIDGVGTANDDPYFVRFFLTLNRIKGEIKQKTIESMKERLQSELCVEITRHINLELQSKFELATVSLAIHQISGMLLVLIASLLNPIAGAVVAVVTGLVTLVIGQDVNSRRWREKIAMEISDEISKQRVQISKKLSSHLWTIFHETSDNLKHVSEYLEDYRRRIAYTD